jgi:putative IMPACT (imprinted ancient) family translation regulator
VAPGHPVLTRIHRHDTYRTLTATRRAETRERGSRFVATAAPARDEAERGAVLEATAVELPGATHHCWAWIAAREGGEVSRAHDAGEPAGTAGPPILQAIRGAGLCDVIVVVSRWFGGVKLGKGGLARAYRAAARAALDGAPAIETVPEARLTVVGPLERDGEMRHLVARHGGRVAAASYGETGSASLTIIVPAAAAEALRHDLQSLTRGAARLIERDETGPS